MKIKKMIKCYKCGKVIETIPTHCGHDMIFNEDTNRWECYMGPDCGFINIDEIICDTCAHECTS